MESRTNQHLHQVIERLSLPISHVLVSSGYRVDHASEANDANVLRRHHTNLWFDHLIE